MAKAISDITGTGLEDTEARFRHGSAPAAAALPARSRQHRHPYEVLEAALIRRHGLDEESLMSVRMRIRYLRNAGFPEAGRGPGKTLDYDGDGFLKLLLAHELIAHGATPTWAARTVLTGWCRTRDALIQAAGGSAVHLVLKPSAIKDNLGDGNDLTADTSATFEPMGSEQIADLLGNHPQWRRVQFINGRLLMEDVDKTLGEYGLDARLLFEPPASVAPTD